MTKLPDHVEFSVSVTPDWPTFVSELRRMADAIEAHTQAVLDADGLPVVRTVGDLTARHQLARPRIRVAGREGKLKIVSPSDTYPGTVTLIWGDWWEDAAPEEPCEVLP